MATIQQLKNKGTEEKIYPVTHKDAVVGLNEITDLIPTQASTDNQLADKSFVNSSVQTATANFRGAWADWNDVPTDSQLYPQDYAGSKTPTTNDYLVLTDSSSYIPVGKTVTIDYIQWDKVSINGIIATLSNNGQSYTWNIDSNGSTITATRATGSYFNFTSNVVIVYNNVECAAGEVFISYLNARPSATFIVSTLGVRIVGTYRFKYTGEWSVNGKAGWIPEYQVNEEPLTAAQIAALNSGATEEIINNIPTKTSQLTNDSGFLTSHQSLTNYLNKTSTANNVLQGIIQIGDANSTKGNAFTHIRKQQSGYASVTGFNVNGAAFAVAADGTASFQHKTFNNTGGDAKNDSVLRFSKATGLQFAKNSTTTSMPVEEDYENIATENWVEGKGYLTEHQPLKTINNESIIGTGNIVIGGGSGGGVTIEQVDQEIDTKLTGYATQEWVLSLLQDGTDIKY